MRARDARKRSRLPASARSDCPGGVDVTRRALRRQTARLCARCHPPSPRRRRRIHSFTRRSNAAISHESFGAVNAADVGGDGTRGPDRRRCPVVGRPHGARTPLRRCPRCQLPSRCCLVRVFELNVGQRLVCACSLGRDGSACSFLTYLSKRVVSN